MQLADIKGKVDFGIITIREDEYKAIIDRFPRKAMVEGGRDYYISEVHTSLSDSYTIAIVRCAEQGNGEAQAVAQDMIRDLDPQWILLVGICGAVPAYEFALGDVVAAIRLHDFCIQAMLEEKESEFAVSGGPMHRDVQDYLAALHGRKEELRGWNDEKSIWRPQPLVELSENKFYGDEQWKKRCMEILEKRFSKSNSPRQPLFTTGSVASSDRLIKDTGILKKWQSTSRDVAAIEMELAGVYKAARQKNREYPVLAIRGISDIVGYVRNPDWTTYACHSAAAFAKALILARPIIPKNSIHPATQLNTQSIATTHNKKALIRFLDESARKRVESKTDQEMKAFTRQLLISLNSDMSEVVNGEKIIDFAQWEIRRDILYPHAYINPIIKKRKGDDLGERFSNYKPEIQRLLIEKQSGYYSVLLGESGIGKTTTLVDCYRDAVENKNIDHYLPIFIKLKLFETPEGKKIIDDLRSNSSSIPSKNKFYWWRIILFLYTNGRAFLIDEDRFTIKYAYEHEFKPIYFETQLNNVQPILFLDALDEIDNISGAVLENLSGLNYIITMRTDFFDRLASENFKVKSDFVLIIQEWTKDEVIDFVARFLHENTKSDKKYFTYEETNYIKNIFKKINIKNSILKKPLFIMMFIFIVYSKKQQPTHDKLAIEKILKNVGLLYKEFLSYWFRKETQRANGNFPKIVSDEILYEKILIYIAWCLFYQKYQKDCLPTKITFPFMETSIFIDSYYASEKGEVVRYWGDHVSAKDAFAASSNEVRSILQIETNNGEETITKFLHESIGEYLVAYSFVCELKKQKFNKAILSNYYPSEITHFINQLMSDEDASAAEIIISNLNQIIEHYLKLRTPSEADMRITNWALYFLSRLIFSLKHIRAASYVIFRDLIECKSDPHPWLKRTAYISLILLGDIEYEEKYLKLIQQDELVCRYNIGDMLRYYGDIQFDTTIHPDKILLQHDETNTKWDKCYCKMMEALSSNSEKDKRLKKFRGQTLMDMLRWLVKSPDDKLSKDDIRGNIARLLEN